MNRTTALLVALGALLAHTLAIYVGPEGHVGVPFDISHVAYRIGRNLARGDGSAWLAGGGIGNGGLDSYPSPLWIGLCWMIERAHESPVRWTQYMCMLSALVTVAVSGRVAAKRLVGIVPPILLVLSGAWASAAASGTEHATTALALTVTFVAGEHRRPLAFAFGLAVLVASRPEAMLVAVLLGPGYTILPYLQPKARKALPPVCLLPAALVLVILFVLRGSNGDPLAIALTRPLLGFEHVTTGLLYLRDFATTSVIPALLFVPLVSLMAGRLSRAGARALFVALVWTTLVLLSGGGPAPFGMALVPALPLAAIAVEEGLLRAMDTGKVVIEHFAWVLLSIATGLSLIASRFPGNLGPVPIEDAHRSWMTINRQPAYGMSPELGRSTLEDELRMAERMRSLGTFLRDEIGGDYSILTPWPGAIGYLSGMEVIDWLGRVTQTSALPAAPPWTSSPPLLVDLLGPIRNKPDFILPGSLSAESAKVGNILDRSLLQLERDPTAERIDQLQSLLADYELVMIPLQVVVRGTPQPFYLLRAMRLDWGPSIAMTHENGSVRIEARIGASRIEPRPGHRQLGNLEILAIDTSGQRHWISPSGALHPFPVLARNELVFNPEGERPTELIDWRVRETSDGLRIQRLEARVLTPGVRRMVAAKRPNAMATIELL